MYCSWEKPLREEKQRKHPKNPSFSSILLDEIFNSIDGNEQNHNETKHVINRSSRKSNNVVDYVKMKATSHSKEAEEIAGMKRACLVDKKVNDQVYSLRKNPSLQEFDNPRSLHDNDHMFFSTSSSSSSDSSSGGLSSSEAELFYSSSSTKSRTVASCFSAKSSSKTNKAAASTAKFPPLPRRSNHQDLSNYKQSECYIFDDFYNTTQQINGHENEDNLMKSKSRAMKMYNNLKKVKQPISPGGRLTSFIASLFTSGHVKKSKEEGKYERKGGKPSSANASTCSSASSFSRPCMSKSVPNPKGKFDDFGVRKTVHFYPVSVIVDEDSRPCGHRTINDEEVDLGSAYGFKRQPRSYQNLETLKSDVLERNKNIDKEVARDVLHKGFKDQEKNEDYNDDYEEDEDVDGVSDCSSDLFEIDHLEVFGNSRFCEELPVYETTHLDRNRAIARGLKV